MNSDELTQTDGEATSKTSKQHIHCTNTQINMNNANADTNVRPPQPPPTYRDTETTMQTRTPAQPAHHTLVTARVTRVATTTTTNNKKINSAEA